MSTDAARPAEALGGDRREMLRFVTQRTRFAILANVLQHPEGLPSMFELEQLNPSVSEATVYKHVRKLVDAGVLREAELPKDERRQGSPWKFYGLSEPGRAFLDEHNLLRAEETLRRIYDTIEDKPAKMERYEAAPRPES